MPQHNDDVNDSGRRAAQPRGNDPSIHTSTHHDITLPDRTAHGAPPPLGSLDDGDSEVDDSDDEMRDNVHDNNTHAGLAPQAQLRTTTTTTTTTHSHGGGDVVLFLGLPEVFTVGYDALSFTAKHFGGVRDVPAGPRFFWAAHPGGMSTRAGFWVLAGGDAVHAVKWDSSSETLVDAPADEMPTDVDGFHAKLLSYHDPTAGLATGDVTTGRSVGDLNEAQAAENERIWAQLTSFVTGELLSRVTGQKSSGRGGRSVWHMSTLDHVKGEVQLSAEREMEERISHMRRKSMSSEAPQIATRELRFSLDQRSKTYSAERFGADRTLEATDSSSYIQTLLRDGAVTEDDLVGELQVAFLAGVHLGNDACLEQWWHVLLRLVFRAYTLPLTHPGLVSDWLRAVTAQLTYGSEWLDTPLAELSEGRARELRLALIIYRRRLEELLRQDDGGGANAEQTGVMTAFARLESVVAGPGFGWDIRGEYLRKGKMVMEDGEEVELEMKELQAEDERGEWAPEVVELDENGRQKDLISWDD